MEQARKRWTAVGGGVTCAAALAAACGLSTSGKAVPGALGEDAATVDGAGDEASSTSDGAGDEASPEASAGEDGAADAARPCAPTDAGLGGTLALSTFTLAGTAKWNENNDGRITLTNSNNYENGAAWDPTPLPVVGGLDLTWSLRVGPSDIAGDGITFAALEAPSAPGVGNDGDGVGLRNVTGPDGGVLAGWAVVVDMFKNSGDPTDLDVTTLKIVAMPGFTVVASTAVPVALNDGATYAVDVSWRAPSMVHATLHGPAAIDYHVSSADPALTLSSPAFLGFTAGTGGGSNSHNEIASAAIVQTCD